MSGGRNLNWQQRRWGTRAVLWRAFTALGGRRVGVELSLSSLDFRTLDPGPDVP